MLLANVSVASHIEKSFPQNALLRRHPSPKASSLETLKQLLKASGIDDFECGDCRLSLPPPPWASSISTSLRGTCCVNVSLSLSP